MTSLPRPRLALSRVHLFVAFAFTVMADPVSSVAYAIEAARRHLGDDATSLFATMAVVVLVIVVVAATYHQLIGRFPSGGGGPEAVASAFGEGWAFIPLGALLVDFTLTVAVSCAAGAAALIAFIPALEGGRLLLALGLTLAVAGGVTVGHRGRIGFAIATQAFLLLAAVIFVAGLSAEPAAAGELTASRPLLSDLALLPILLALPLGMALATGIEAPSNAIAQLPQLDDRSRVRFGRLTLWLMVAIVGALTLAFAGLAMKLELGLPASNSTMLADIADRAVGGGALFAFFQAASALLLLAAAASSYLAGSGVLKALALFHDGGVGLLPARFGRVNRYLVPLWGIGLVLLISAGLIVAAGGREQALVPFYAVSVFASFLAATVAAARLSHREGRRRDLAINLAGAALVGIILAINLSRLDAVIALACSAAIGAGLWATWVKRGRPAGVAGTVR